MDLKNYIQVMLRGWWLIALSLVVAITSALWLTSRQTPIYLTKSTLVVSPSESLASTVDVFRSLDMISKRDGILATYIAIAESGTVRSQVYEELDLGPEQRGFLSISGELVPSTNIIEITVEDSDPQRARDVADMVGQKTTNFVKGLYEAYDIKPLDAAFTPRSPAKPSKVQNVLLASILGLVTGVGLAFLLENLRSSRQVITGVTIMDADTGLYNRYYLLSRLNEEFSRAQRHHQPLSLAFTNVDQLDMITDMHLPHLKHQVLRRVGFFLKDNLREEDLVARFEDNQFALLLPNVTGIEAEEILNQLHTRLMWKPFEADDGQLRLNLSATSGIAAYESNGIGRDDLIARARFAARRAGEKGYGVVHLFDENADTS